MNKVVIRVLVVAVILSGVFVYFRNAENKTYKTKGNLLIEKVELYKSQNSRLPKSLEELNIEPEMGEGPYYEKIDSVKYIVYFNIGFDNTFTYFSDTETWKETP